MYYISRIGHTYYFILGQDQFHFNTSPSFLYDILNFLAICSELEMETNSKKAFSDSERNINQHHTSYMLLCIFHCCRHFTYQVEI